jgi:hypothetical protein
VFNVARAGGQSLAFMGYQVSGEGEKCELKDPEGRKLDLLRAIGVVTYAYGEDLLRRGGADLAAFKRSREAGTAVTAPFQPRTPVAVPVFDGRKP